MCFPFGFCRRLRNLFRLRVHTVRVWTFSLPRRAPLDESSRLACGTTVASLARKKTMGLGCLVLGIGLPASTSHAVKPGKPVTDHRRELQSRRCRLNVAMPCCSVAGEGGQPCSVPTLLAYSSPKPFLVTEQPSPPLLHGIHFGLSHQKTTRPRTLRIDARWLVVEHPGSPGSCPSSPATEAPPILPISCPWPATVTAGNGKSRRSPPFPYLQGLGDGGWEVPDARLTTPKDPQQDCCLFTTRCLAVHREHWYRS